MRTVWNRCGTACSSRLSQTKWTPNDECEPDSSISIINSFSFNHSSVRLKERKKSAFVGRACGSFSFDDLETSDPLYSANKSC